MLKHCIFGVLFMVSISTCVRLGQNRGPAERATWDKLAPPPWSTLSPRFIDIATLGHRGLYDDFVGIWILQLLADPNLASYASADGIKSNIRLSLRHAPKLESLYLFSCFTMALQFSDPEFCEEITRVGLTAFPESWRIPMTQGFISAFKLGDNAKAAVYYAVASTRPSSPPYVAKLAVRLANKDDTNPEDLNETLEVFKNIPGGTKLLELLRPQFKTVLPSPVQQPALPEQSMESLKP